jgi:hypothetical protein
MRDCPEFFNDPPTDAAEPMASDADGPRFL